MENKAAFVGRILTALSLSFLCAAGAQAQWILLPPNLINSDCPSPPCKVQINPGITSNANVGLEVGGDLFATGISTDIYAKSVAGSAALVVDAPSSEVAHVLLRSGGNESITLRREAGTHDFTILTNQYMERLRITADGRVGIGTPNPSQPLHVAGNILGGSFGAGGAAPSGFPFFATNSTNGVSSAIKLRSNYAYVSTSYVGNFGEYGTVVSQNRDPQVGAFVDAAAAPNQYRAADVVVGETIRGRLFQVRNWPGGVETVRLFIDYNGNVGIGAPSAFPEATRERLNVDGNIHVSGNINAKYQDLAEWVEAPETFEPGTVVVLDPARNNGVIASASAYDTSAAGVVSAQPGITLGERSDSTVAVATTGRVRVKVDATRAPIRIGDLLVTSDIPGTAMKSLPVEVGGIAMHRPGTLIGKALEPLESGQGEILVLLSLQ